MRRLHSLAAVALCAGVTRPAPAVQAPSEAALAFARFRLGEDSTLAFAFLRLPDPAAHGSPYRVSIRLTDSAGRAVWDTTWTRHGAAAGPAVAAFAIRVGPGRFQATATVEALPRGSTRRVVSDLAALPASAPLSDLLVSAEAGPGRRDPDTDVVTLRFGDVTLTDAGWPRLTAGSAMLGTYVQVYAAPIAEAPSPDSLRLWVEDTTRARRYASPAVAASRGGRVSTLDLRALPPGRYRLAAAFWGPGRDSVVRTAGFSILARAAAPAAGRTVDMFSGASEARLDSLYAPLFYLMTSEERGVYSLLSLEEKRAYLRKFWARRNLPGAPRNQAAERFYARIDSANRAFREGGAAEIPGWRTDRGRIYILNGAPDEVLSRPQPASTQPYEVWKYTRGRARKYVFFDLTGFGNYVLIYTTDIHEVSRPNWWELLGREAMEDVLRF